MNPQIRVTAGPRDSDFAGVDDLSIQAAIEYVVA